MLVAGQCGRRKLSTAAVTAAAARISAQQRRTNGTDPYRICIVGSGPAGFYTADRVFKTFGDKCRVDILEQLPTPFGLVRSGVAPDHPETKNVIHNFQSLAADPRCRFFGNVTVGSDVSVNDLRSSYDAVVLAYGAESDRSLNIPGEKLSGVLSAREFVWWYNCHPFVPGNLVDLSRVTSAVVIGVGNVALDCARVLLSSPEQLQDTDIAQHALDQLRSSSIQHVHLVARRGPVQMACTPKELRELLQIAGQNLHVCQHVLQPTPSEQSEMAASRIKRRLHEVLSKAAAQAKPRPEEKQLHFHFFQSPSALLGDPGGAVARVTLSGSQPAPVRLAHVDVTGRGRGQDKQLPAQLVLKSIGYKAKPLAGVAFDGGKGIIPNRDGRVLTDHGNVEAGVYVSGWLRRGPTGIIGTNIPDAEVVVGCIAEDLSKVEPKPVQTDLKSLLKAAGVPVFTLEDWQALDSEERRRGQLVGKPREKFATLPDMLRAQSRIEGREIGS